MKTYLKIQFSSEAEPPSRIIDRLEAIGWKTVVGDYDFVMEGGIGEGVGNSYKKMVDELHNALRGTGVRYSLYSFY